MLPEFGDSSRPGGGERRRRSYRLQPTRPKLRVEHPGRTHASAEVHRLVATSPNKTLDLAAIRGRCTRGRGRRASFYETTFEKKASTMERPSVGYKTIESGETAKSFRRGAIARRRGGGGKLTASTLPCWTLRFRQALDSSPGANRVSPWLLFAIERSSRCTSLASTRGTALRPKQKDDALDVAAWLMQARPRFGRRRRLTHSSRDERHSRTKKPRQPQKNLYLIDWPIWTPSGDRTLPKGRWLVVGNSPWAEALPKAH